MELCDIEPPKIAGIFLFPEKINPVARIDDLIARDLIFQAVQDNNAVIVHVRNRIVFDDVPFGKAHPDAVNAVVQIVADDLIAGAKTQFDGVVKNVVDVIARDDVVVAARDAVRLDKNAVSVAAAHFIVQNPIAARTILHRDPARVAPRTDDTRAPCAVAHITVRRIARDFAVGRLNQIDAPRGIVGRIVASHVHVGA